MRGEEEPAVALWAKMPEDVGRSELWQDERMFFRSS